MFTPACVGGVFGNSPFSSEIGLKLMRCGNVHS